LSKKIKNRDWKKVKRAWRGWNKAHLANNPNKMKEYQTKLLEIYGRLGIKARRKT